MDKLKKINWSKYIAYIILGALAVLSLVFAIAFKASGSVDGSVRQYIPMLKAISVNMLLAVSLSLVVGFLGELSLGHAGFMCVGAYIGGKLAVLLSGSLGGTNLLTVVIAMLAAGLIAGIFGFVVGLPALRLRGDYLAIVTLAFNEIVRVVFLNSSESSFGGVNGLSTPAFATKDAFTLITISLITVILAVAVIQNLIRSKHGRAITAIRDNEIAAKASGINVTKYKLMAFIVAAIFAGVAGALDSFGMSKVDSNNFTYNRSIDILVMVVLGGMSINGSLISAALITFIDLRLGVIIPGAVKDLIYALILIVIVIYRNAPALKGFREKYNFRTLTDKIFRRKHDPSHVKDDAGRWDVVPTKIDMDEVLSTDIKVVESTLKPDKEEKR